MDIVKDRFYTLLLLFFSVQLPAQSGYEKEIMEWRKDRLSSLTGPQSWTSLYGLYWLGEGNTSIGQDDKADIELPGLVSNCNGSFTKSKDDVSFRSDHHGEQQMKLNPDQGFQHDFQRCGRYAWILIKRGSQYGVRVWDTLNENRFKYPELPYYDISEKWKVKANLQKYPVPGEKQVTNILGMKVTQRVFGKLEFRIDEETFTLDAYDGGEDKYFLIFSDLTTGGETYGGGRYLYCERENENGEVFIDFNKAYTPPCGFTPHATCLLPDRDNFLNIEVAAGEQYDGGHH